MMGATSVTEAEADLQFRAIRSEQAFWAQELANIEAVQTHSDALWDTFWGQLKGIKTMFNYGFHPTAEQKKKLLNLVTPDKSMEYYPKFHLNLYF